MPKNGDAKHASQFTTQGECGRFANEDTSVLYEEHFNNLNFSDSNYTTIYAKDAESGEMRLFYVSKIGRVVRVFFFDNGADYFKEGLARTISKGKIGFINNKLYSQHL